MKRWNAFIALLVAALVVWPLHALAVNTDPNSSSSNYSVSESYFGNGADVTSNSTNYSSGGSTLGDNAVGNSSSSNYQTNSGFNTTPDPALTFIVNTSSVDLGVLSPASMGSGTATFSAKDYTSYGYAVTLLGSPPTNSGHALTALSTDTASSAGTEQYGLNTVLNTVASLGANPVQVPSSNFSYGVAGDGTTGTFGTTRPYTISDKYRFVSGETIASAPKSSGETDYTMSIMANISSVTPGGKYSGNLTLICTGTF